MASEREDRRVALRLSVDRIAAKALPGASNVVAREELAHELMTFTAALLAEALAQTTDMLRRPAR